MKTLEELGYKLIYSGPTPNATWGKHWIHANKIEGYGSVYGYGSDEASAVQNAITTLERPKDEPKATH